MKLWNSNRSGFHVEVRPYSASSKCKMRSFKEFDLYRVTHVVTFNVHYLNVIVNVVRQVWVPGRIFI